MRYSTDVDPDKTAKAFGYELHCSRKDSRNIAHAIKGMKVPEGKKYLQEIIDQKRALPAVYHKQKRAHQKRIEPRSFPQKEQQQSFKSSGFARACYARPDS